MLQIEIDGTSTVNSSGLVIQAGGTTVRGLVINRFPWTHSGIQLESGGNTIAGNFIGTDSTGTEARGNGGPRFGHRGHHSSAEYEWEHNWRNGPRGPLNQIIPGARS